MPKRSNEFQELVTMIQRTLVPKGARVTTSAMVPGPNSGTLREIDILVETAIGPYSVKIAVEAKDEKRKLDATKIEAIIGKYRGRGSLMVNKVVVVSHRGFTKEAESRAKDEGVDLYTLREAQRNDWSKFVGTGFEFHCAPYPVIIQVSPLLPREIDSNSLVNKGLIVCTCCGKDYGTPRSWILRSLERTAKINPSFTPSFKLAAMRNNGMFEAWSEIGAPKSLRSQELIVIRFEGTDYPFTKLHTLVRSYFARTAFTTKTYEMKGALDSRTFIHRQGKAGPCEFSLMQPEGEKCAHGQIKIGLGPNHSFAVGSPHVRSGP